MSTRAAAGLALSLLLAASDAYADPLDAGVDAQTVPLPATPDAIPELPPNIRPSLTLTLKGTEQLATGDVFTARVELRARAGDEINFLQQSLTPFEVRKKNTGTTTKGEVKTYWFDFELLALEPGDHTLPPIEFRVLTREGTVGTVHTAPKAVRVRSLLANEPNAEPKPPTKPVSVMEKDYTLIWIASILGGVLFTALLTLLLSRWWKRRVKIAPPPPPPRPPWEVALEKLSSLRARRADMFQELRTTEWVDGVSDAIREYLGGRYDFDGLESTTDEILARLERVHMLGSSPGEVAHVLSNCDLIKFARATPSEADCEQLLQWAYHIVQRTIPSPSTTTEGASR